MKKVLFLLSIVSLVVVSSCGGDDDDATPVEVGLSGTVTFDGQSYTIANGIFNQTDDDGNAVGTFYMADGTISPGTNGGVTSSNSTIIIGLVAVAFESSTLENGNYDTNSNLNGMQANVTVSIDGVSNRSFTGGDVTLTGSGNSYNITFIDVPFGQGVTLSGTVTGVYSNE